MGAILSALTGSSFTDGIAKILALFKIDPNAAAQHAADLAKIQTDYETAVLNATSQQLHDQAAVNLAEASSTDKFTSRARPTILYICGAAFFSNFVVSPFATWIAGLFGHPIVYPTLDMSLMTPILLGVLGLAAGHVYETTTTAKNK